MADWKTQLRMYKEADDNKKTRQCPPKPLYSSHETWISLRTNIRMKLWKWLFLVLLLGGGVAAWYWYQASSKENALEYKTTTVTRGDLTQAVTANGQINPVKSVTVGSQVSGIITDIKVDFNSKVTNGQVIAQIDPSTYQQ